MKLITRDLNEVTIIETEEEYLLSDILRKDMDYSTVTIVIYAKSQEKRLSKILNIDMEEYRIKDMSSFHIDKREVLFMTPAQVKETQGGALLTSPNIILFGFKEGSKKFYGLSYKMLWKSVCQFYEGRLLAIK